MARKVESDDMEALCQLWGDLLPCGASRTHAMDEDQGSA